MVTFKLGQQVTDLDRTTRYRVECIHRDGSITVRAYFHLNPNGTDRLPFLGDKFREDWQTFTELRPATGAAP